MNLKKSLKKNGYRYERKSRDETVISPNLKMHRGFGYFAIVLGIFRAFSGNVLFSIIPIIAGLYWIMEPESEEFKAIHINESLHIISEGVEIRSKSGRKFYASEELGDLQINQTTFNTQKVVTLTTTVKSSGENLIIMQAIDSEKNKTLQAFQSVANRMVDNWVKSVL